MEYDETITSLGQGVDLAVLECSYPDRASLQGKGAHLCPEDIGRLAMKGNFKKTFLTHLYPACEGREEEMIQKIEGMSPTKVTIAYDFMSVDF
jgi:ribonuclease BN (tRNA processing enzyme)